ncbi:hypothetical protein B7P43_G15934 [Cryptotermes secundus]|uniref:Dynein regulatory complex protein 9 n=1 Tax=Cryptotermes secundus TaxID=105785 RepID=A0A2J7RJ52_9NEOP|nr:hypothetical protein B7P43_G15934 [Cryptotermes secundus]
MSLDPLWYVLFCRATLEAILQKTLEELKLKKSFKTLVKVSELEVQQQNEEAELISAEERNVKETNKLHNILEGDLKKGMDKMNKKSDTIAWLKDEIHDTLFMNDLKFKYISKWERAREEQNGARLSHSEKRLQDRLIDLQDSTDMELRSHVEIEMYLKQAITNLEAEIERWMEKYNTELEDRETELQNLQAKRAMKYKELQALASLYQERQKEIDAYLAYKEKQAAKAAHEAFLYRMATIIQAWWRGTMVRRGLGPYKKSKRGKDKKGKGKGGKGGPKKKI